MENAKVPEREENEREENQTAPLSVAAENEEEKTQTEGAGERLPAETPEKSEKVRAFFGKYGGVVFAPLVVFIAYFCQLAASGVWPFGSAYVVASYDLSAQICPFIEHLFDVLDGKSSLFYSYSIAGGADVFGTFAYFFVSPFSFLYLICGDGNVHNACGIVMALKLAAIAFSGAWFVRKLFDRIPAYAGGAVGVVYAYCGYVFVASTYVNWIDFLFYMPLGAIAFVRFVKTGKFLAFSAVLACCIYTCFSIACFSFFILFPTLVAYAFLCVGREERNRFIAYLCIAFVVAVLAALPILLPSFMAYLSGGRGGGLFDEFWYGLGEGEDGAFDVSGFFDRAGTAWYRKFSYIFSDSLFLILTVVWLVRTRLKTPLSKFMLVAGIATLLPACVDEAMLLMNMGSYMSYALRFGFLNALYFLGGACLAINGCTFAPDKAFDGGELLDKGGRKESRTIFYALVCLVCAVILAVFVAGNFYIDIWDVFISDESTLADLHGFSSSFAHSLGGMQVIAILFFIVGFVVLLGVLMVRNREIGVRVMSFLLLGVVGVQVLFYNEQLVVGNSATHYNVTHYSTMVEQLNEREEGYFRVKDYEDKLSANAPFTGNANSFSVFSSVIDGDNFVIYNLFGYSGNGRNSLKSTGGNAFGDAFLGYKYFFTSSEGTEGGRWSQVNALSYTEPVLVEGEDGTSSQMTAGAFAMFENTMVFPNGYTVSSGDLHFPEENTAANRSKNQVALYDFLRGTKSNASAVTTDMTQRLSRELWNRAAEVEVGAGEITATVTADAGEYLFLNFVASDGYRVTVNGKEAQLVENDLHFLLVALEEGENVVHFTYSSPYVKYAGIGLAAAIVGLFAVWLVLKKTRLVEKGAGIIAWAGVSLAIAVVLFFMVFPTLVFLWKILNALWTKLGG